MDFHGIMYCNVVWCCILVLGWVKISKACFCKPLFAQNHFGRFPKHFINGSILSWRFSQVKSRFKSGKLIRFRLPTLEYQSILKWFWAIIWISCFEEVGCTNVTTPDVNLRPDCDNNIATRPSKRRADNVSPKRVMMSVKPWRLAMCHDTPGAAVKHRLQASASTSRRCAKAGDVLKQAHRSFQQRKKL